MSIFHPTYLVLIAGVSHAFLAGDLFNLYVGFEILLVASYVLITLGGTGAASGPAHLRGRQPAQLDDLPHRDRPDLRRDRHPEHGAAGPPAATSCPRHALLLQSMLLLAFAIKAAVFPLPPGCPTATRPRRPR